MLLRLFLPKKNQAPHGHLAQYLLVKKLWKRMIYDRECHPQKTIFSHEIILALVQTIYQFKNFYMHHQALIQSCFSLLHDKTIYSKDIFGMKCCKVCLLWESDSARFSGCLTGNSLIFGSRNLWSWDALKSACIVSDQGRRDWGVKGVSWPSWLFKIKIKNAIKCKFLVLGGQF